MNHDMDTFSIFKRERERHGCLVLMVSSPNCKGLTFQWKRNRQSQKSRSGTGVSLVGKRRYQSLTGPIKQKIKIIK